MMALTACCLYLLLILLVGYVVVSVIYPSSRMGIVQLVGLGSSIGAGTMGLLLFWLSLMGMEPSRKVLAIIGCMALTALLFLKNRNRVVRLKGWPQDWEKGDRWIIVPLVILFASVAIMAIGAISAPLTEWDAFAIWGFKAKVVTHEALHPTPAYFHDLTLSYSHLDYPLMVPFLTAGAYAAMGIVDDQTAKMVSMFLDVLIVPLVYLGLRWKLKRLPAACLSATLAILPTTFLYAGRGCADVPLAMFYAGGVIYVVRWITQKEREDLILAILFNTFVAFTKSEGVVLAMISGLVILGFGSLSHQRYKLAGTGLFFAGLLVISAPWFIWSSFLPHTHEGYGSKLLSSLLVTNLPRLKQIIPAMVERMTEFHVWGLLWIMAGAIAVLGWRAFARQHLQAMWILLGLHLTSYALAYMVTPWDLAVLFPITMDRLLFHAVPAVILLAGWHWAELGRTAEISESLEGSDATEAAIHKSSISLP